MSHPPDYSPDQGAYFEVHFTKARGLFGDDTKPFTAKLTTSSGVDCWTVQDLAQSTAEKVAELLAEGMRQQDIAEYLELSKGAISKAVKKAQSLGLVKVS
jgi:putative DNA primase/helicase